MKKLLITLVVILLSSPCYAGGILMMGGGTGGAGGACTASGTMLCTNDNDYWDVNYGTNTTYQQVNNAASINICKVDLKLYLTGVGSENVHVEIWDSGITGKIGGNSTTQAVTSTDTAGVVTSFTWSTCPNPTGNYAIVAVREANVTSVRIRSSYSTTPDANPGSGCYDSTTYGAYAQTGDRSATTDFYFKVYTQ